MLLLPILCPWQTACPSQLECKLTCVGSPEQENWPLSVLPGRLGGSFRRTEAGGGGRENRDGETVRDGRQREMGDRDGEIEKYGETEKDKEAERDKETERDGETERLGDREIGRQKKDRETEKDRVREMGRQRQGILPSRQTLRAGVSEHEGNGEPRGLRGGNSDISSWELGRIGTMGN